MFARILYSLFDNLGLLVVGGSWLRGIDSGLNTNFLFEIRGLNTSTVFTLDVVYGAVVRTMIVVDLNVGL